MNDGTDPPESAPASERSGTLGDESALPPSLAPFAEMLGRAANAAVLIRGEPRTLRLNAHAAWMDAALRRAIDKASGSLRHMRWFEVDEIRGHIEDNALHHWQVGVKLGFTMEQSGAPETLEEKKEEA